MPEQEDSYLVGAFPSVPKQERAYQKRNALLESGQSLFIEKGFEHTTAKEIAANANVATGTFYRYFSDKRQLLMSLLKNQLERFIPPEPNWMNCDPESNLSSLLEGHFKQLDKLGLYHVLSELLPHDTELAEVYGEARRKLHDSIHEGLKQARNIGFTWEDLDLDSITWSIMVLIEKLPEKEGDSGRKPDYQSFAKIICRMVFPPEIISQIQSGKRESQKYDRFN